MLARVLAGDADARLEERVRSCPVCRAKLAELTAVIERLDAAGELQRGVLEEAQRLAGAPGETRVAGAFARTPARRKRLVPAARWLVLAAVVLVVVAVWAFQHTASTPSRDRLYLDGEQSSGMSPLGE